MCCVGWAMCLVCLVCDLFAGLRLRLVVCGLVTLVVVLVVGGFGFVGGWYCCGLWFGLFVLGFALG